MKQEPQIILCPYCGHVQTVPETAAVPDQCNECKGLFEPLSRRATQISMGPWFIRDKKNPFRPGCSYEVLTKMAKNNRIRPTTVMRGPSTKQFWSVARNVPGIAHLLGYCHQCSAKVEPTATSCTACNAKFEEPKERNELGLAYRTAQDAAAAQRALEKEIAAITGAPVNSSASGIAPAMSAAPGADLLDQVLGGGKFGGSPLLNFGSGAPAATATATSSAAPPVLPKPPVNKPAPAVAAPGAPLNFAAGFSAGGAGVAGGRAVDAFSLAGDADDTGIDDVQRKQKTASTMTWALIGFNVVLVIVVIVLFLVNKGKPANAVNDNDDQNPPATGPVATDVPSNSKNDPRAVTTPPVGPKVMKTTDAFGNPIVDGGNTPPVVPKTNVKPDIDPRDDRNVMSAKLAEARTKLDAGDIAGALKVMREVRDAYPEAWQPEDLSQRIDQFAAMLDKSKVIVEEARMADEVTSLLAQAKAAQTANDHETVLRTLTQIHENYPPKFHPKDLTKSIIFSMKEVERKKKDGGKFFGQSTD